jgi:ABC-type Fe3+ transport system permease subunit
MFFFPSFSSIRLQNCLYGYKRHERAKTEELIVGIFVAGIPFVVTLVLSRFVWYVGHRPFFLSDSASALKISDYQTVFNGLYSEHYFENHVAQFWESFWRTLLLGSAPANLSRIVASSALISSIRAHQSS